MAGVVVACKTLAVGAAGEQAARAVRLMTAAAQTLSLE
jgi:hypothetical protein